MGNCYWNSKSIYLKNYKYIEYKDTLRNTIDYIRNEDKREKNTKINNVFTKQTKNIMHYILGIGVGCLIPFLYYNKNINTSFFTEGAIFKMNWGLI